MSKPWLALLCFVVTKVLECWPKAWRRPADHRGERKTDAGLYCPSLIACTPHAGMPLKIAAVYCNFFVEITGGGFLRDSQSSELIPPEEKMQSSRIILHGETWQEVLILQGKNQMCCVLIL